MVGSSSVFPSVSSPSSEVSETLSVNPFESPVTLILFVTNGVENARSFIIN